MGAADNKSASTDLSNMVTMIVLHTNSITNSEISLKTFNNNQSS
jgi:hypothetical protein